MQCLVLIKHIYTFVLIHVSVMLAGMICISLPVQYIHMFSSQRLICISLTQLRAVMTEAWVSLVLRASGLYEGFKSALW